MTLVFALLAPVAGVPPMGAGWPGGGGGICDMDQSPPVAGCCGPDYRRNPSKTPYPKGVRQLGTAFELTLLGSPPDGGFRSAGQISFGAAGPQVGAGA